MIRETEVEAYTDVPIVDNETRNTINFKERPVRYWIGKPHCVGIFYKNKVKQFIFVKEEETEEDFKKAVKEELDKLGEFYALNRDMEFGNFRGYLNKDYTVKEIKPFKGFGSGKDDLFDKLLENGLVDQVVLDTLKKDAIKSGGEMMRCFKEGLYEEVLKHNFNCLLKEFSILKNKDWLLKRMPPGCWVPRG